MKVLIIVASGFLGEILLQKRKDNGWRAIIGGSLEMGETIEEAVAREVKEETGQIVTKCQYVSSYYFEPKQLIIFSKYVHSLSYKSGTNLVQKRGVVGEAPFSAAFRNP